MPLFHATTNDYRIDQVVTADTPCQFYPLAVSLIEDSRPDIAPSRSTCLFAADNASFAYLYALKQGYEASKIRLYKVSMNVSHRAPFAVVHATQRRVENGMDTSRLVSEYWEPAQTWRFFEYFGPEIKIIDEIPLPTINETVLSVQYQNDFDRASSF